LSEAEDGASNMQAADIFVDGDATGSLRACRSIADSRNFEKSSLALAQSEEESRRVLADRFHHERHFAGTQRMY